jgi:sigma-B regulation protein RsbQ
MILLKGMDVLERNNVKLYGREYGQAMIFAHGFGCDQNMWRFVAPSFENEYRVILFDNVGAGHSDLTAYHRDKYDTLEGYATDLLQICRQLGVSRAVFVGHSVSAMVGILAAIREPDRFSDLVLVNPSPRYLDDEDYVGGFSPEDIQGLFEAIDNNYLGWSSVMAPLIVGNPDRPELGKELASSFCRTDPDIAQHLARVTFLSDNRADLPKLQTRSLILQCADDVIAPKEVGDYLHRHLPSNELCRMQATGHCPNLSAPEETIAAMRSFL